MVAVRKCVAYWSTHRLKYAAAKHKHSNYRYGSANLSTLSAPVKKKNRGETLNLGRLGGKTNTLTRAEEEKFIWKCATVVKRRQCFPFLKKTVGNDVKHGLIELEELSDRISICSQA